MRVVIDPGHGAPDPRAHAGVSKQADVNLDVSFFIARESFCLKSLKSPHR